MKRLYNLSALIMVLMNANFYAQSCTTVNSFPFKETFEENSPSRSCWSQEVIGGNSPGYEAWVFQTGAGGGAVGTAGFSSSSDSCRTSSGGGS